MRATRASVWAAVAALVSAVVPASADAVDARLAGAQSFAFAIGNHMLDGSPAVVGDRFAPFDVVIVDGEEATPSEIAAIDSRGSVVLGYLSVGTIEKWRSWYPQVKRYRLNADQNWRDEWFADTSRSGYRDVIVGEVAPSLLDKGFDGLFLDNVDMIEARSHRDQRRGMRRLVARLSGLVHTGDGLLFAQNGAWILDRLDMVGYLDGWNREDVTWTYDFDHKRYVAVGARAHHEALAELSELAGRDLFVTATDYTARARGRAEAQSVANACGAGALPYVSNIGLTLERLPDPPLACP